MDYFLSMHHLGNLSSKYKNMLTAKSEIGQSRKSKVVDTSNKEISVILAIVNSATMNIGVNIFFELWFS